MPIFAFAGGSSSSTVTAAIQLSLCHDMQRLGGLIAGGHQTHWGDYGLQGNLSSFQAHASTMAPFCPFFWVQRTWHTLLLYHCLADAL